MNIFFFLFFHWIKLDFHPNRYQFYLFSIQLCSFLLILLQKVRGHTPLRGEEALQRIPVLLPFDDNETFLMNTIPRIPPHSAEREREGGRGGGPFSPKG